MELDNLFDVANATRLSLCICSSTLQEAKSLLQCLRASKTERVSTMPCDEDFSHSSSKHSRRASLCDFCCVGSHNAVVDE